MSLAITIYVPTGIVMAADSRVTGTLTREEEQALPNAGQRTVRIQQQLAFSDNAQKLIALDEAGVGISCFDSVIIEGQTIETHIQEFDMTERPRPTESVETIAVKLIDYFKECFQGVGVGFHVAGYRREGDRLNPQVFSCHTQVEPTPVRRNTNQQGKVVYGITRSGETTIPNRIIDPNSTPYFDAMPLQDAVDYALFLMRTTIEALRFEPRYAAVGGPVDVLVITSSQMQFVQRKELHGERSAR
jgi:hypothetical protein